MKTRLAILALIPCFAVSCATSGGVDKAKLQAIGDLALSYAEASGKITPRDAAAAREAGKLLLSDQPAPVVVEAAPSK